MRRAWFLPVVFSWLLAAELPAADRVALVIGNNAYQHARPLNAAVNDANAVADTLHRLGFDTIQATNAGLEQMVEAMETLKGKASGAQAVIVYYAGHGIESQGANYLIPVDARLEKEVQLQTQSVNLNAVLDKLTALNVPARMVILDCCRDNPLEGRTWLATRSAGAGGLAELPVQSLPAATLVVYAASPGKPALDRVAASDRHSPFTQALLDTLPQPGIHSFEIFGRVEEAVIERTEGRQSPRLFYNGSTLPFRNFSFAPGASALAVQEAPPAPVPAPAPVMVQESPPPAPQVVTLVLPSRGYFNVDELFEDGPYASYNGYSQGRILKMAQEKLRSLGFYSGTPDGVTGPGTQKAVIAWQQAAGVSVTGRLDAASVDKLGIGGVPQMTAPAPVSRPSPSRPAPRPRPSAEDFFINR